MQSGRVLMIRFNIQTSLRGSKSISIAATHAFVEAYRTAHPDVTVDNLNVWEQGLPEFDSEAIGGRAGLEPTEEEVRHAPENPGPHRPAPRLDPTCCKASGMEVSCANRIEDEIQCFVQTLPVRKGCVMPIE